MYIELGKIVNTKKNTVKHNKVFVIFNSFCDLVFEVWTVFCSNNDNNDLFRTIMMHKLQIPIKIDGRMLYKIASTYTEYFTNSIDSGLGVQ